MPKNFIVKLNKEQTYNHLKALCNNDAMFSIGKEDIDFDFERLVISNAKAEDLPVIGTIRLLQVNDVTNLMFVDKDAFSDRKIPKSNTKLFVKYFDRVKKHFYELDLLIQKSEKIQKDSVETDSNKEQIWKLVCLVIYLAIIFLGFYFLREYNEIAVLWLVILIILSPLVFSFLSPKKLNWDITEMYKAGVAQLQEIFKLPSNWKSDK